MLRAVIRRGLSSNHGPLNLRSVCAFCEKSPRRLKSTVSVFDLDDSPSKPQRSTPPPRGVLKDGISANDKSRDKPQKKVKGKGKGKPKSKKSKDPKAIGKPKARLVGVCTEVETPSERAIEEFGKSITQAMNPKGTKILYQEAGLTVNEHEIEPVRIKGQPPVAKLSHGLDRVLFNPGVVYLQDPRSRVFNFDPYLQKILPVTEFDFDAVAGYITSSQDTKLESLMKELDKKYMGSTSSMTSILSHFHFLLSAWRPINIDILSKSFATEYRSFTQLSRLPTSIFLRYKGGGTYAIDADKELDGDNILSFMGRSMEKMLTLSPEVFEKYRRDNSHELTEEDRNAPETYHYSTFGDFLMRSQLDAHDPRLPGTGMFDLKTRAVVAVRVDVRNFQLGSGYQIKTRTGNWESFEREYFDMIRAAFLKYSMQVRMGRMDGIFVAFHNTEKIFGFQYISLDEMDATIHEGPGSGIGAEEFKMSLSLLNKLLDQAIERFPEKSLRIHFETRETQVPYMYVFAEPMEEGEIEAIQIGERDSVEEFMEKVKVKIEESQGTREPVTETEAGVEIDIEDDKSITQEPDKHEINDIEQKAVDAETTDEATPQEPDEQEISDTEKINKFEEEIANKEIENDMHSDEVDESLVNEFQAKPEKDEGKPLMGVILTSKNFVNGKEVLRPDYLGEGDIWEVAYSISEFTTTSKAWSVYNALKIRKKKAFSSRLSSSDPEQVGGYTKYVRSLSVKGRDWEKNEIELQRGKEAVVYRSTE